MRIAKTSKEQKKDVDQQEYFSQLMRGNGAKVGKTKGARGHEKKHQGKVVRGEKMWCFQPAGQETTPREQALRTFSDVCASWSSKLP
jgi:hypothetical protein